MRWIGIILLFVCLSASAGDVQYLSTDRFREHVFDFRKEKEWCYKGDTPCVIDFYARWCKPCQLLTPVMEELSETYCDQVIFYRTDTDLEPELAYYFMINAIPLVMYIPVEGEPVFSQGLYPWEDMTKIIDGYLLKVDK